MQKRFRQQRVEGVAIPGIIKNYSYFLVDIVVYEDGGTYCWDLCDQEMFIEKMNSQWVVPEIPVGENISIHGLGSYKITQAQWQFNQKTYLEHIQNIQKKLSTDVNNQFLSTQLEKAEKRRVGFNAHGKDFIVEKEEFYSTHAGGGFHIFMHHQGQLYLVNLVVYKSGELGVYGLDKDIHFHIDEVDTLFNDGTFRTQIADDEWVFIKNLGQFQSSSDGSWFNEIADKLTELKNIYIELNDQETDFDLCKKYYLEYLQDPSEFYRMKMKEHYEKIPEHERMYLGSMDTKDHDFQRIIYRPEEKREV